MRTNCICCVTIALYSDDAEEPEYVGMYIEADTPEDAYQYAKEYAEKTDFSRETCCFYDEVEIYSYETYCTKAYDYMERIFIENGKSLTYKEYITELEKKTKSI